MDAAPIALEEALALARQLLETSQVIPWRMEPGGLRFSYVGRQAFHILGHELEAWTAEGFLERYVHPEDLRALQTDGEIELRIAAADGKEMFLRGTVQTTLDPTGRPVRSGLFLDDTARHLLESERRITQKLESLGRMASGVAHEINTPVQFVADSVRYIQDAVTSVSSLLGTYRAAVRTDLDCGTRTALAERARAADEEADTDYVLANVPPALESALEGLERIGRIVKSLKDFSQPDRTEKTAVDLNASIQTTLALATNETAAVADVQTDLGTLDLVHCHGAEINQVLLDLIVNASHAIADANRTTAERGRIKVRTWQDDEWVHVCVRDTGTGIPAAIRDKIFDPFFTTKEVGRGKGQGLALARRVVVDKHGGELTFETEMGRGTAFILRLPSTRRPIADAA